MSLINPGDTKLNFFNNMDLASFKDFVVENSDSTFAKDILASGIESYFNSLDKDNNGILNEADTDSVITMDSESFDNDIETISLSNFLGASLFNDSEEGQNDIALDTEAVEASAYQSEVVNSDEFKDLIFNNFQSNETFVGVSNTTEEVASTIDLSSILASFTAATNTTEYGVDDLKKQKVLLQLSSNSKIQALESELSSLILNNGQVDRKLKNSYSEKQQELNSCEDSIKETEQQIAENEAKKAAVEAQIASVNGQLALLSTSTSDKNTNTKNANKRAELNSTLSGLYEQKTALTDAISALNAGLVSLNTQKDSVETELDAILVDISKNATELSSSIAQKRQEISSEKANQTNTIASMDAQIASKEAEVAAQAQEVQAAEDAAESSYTQTQDASNEFGDSIVKKAKKYLGDSESNGRYKKFSTGDYGWCADYVTYVVMKVCKEKGMSDKELKEVRKHLGASPYKLRTRNSKNYYNTKKMSKAERKEFTQNTLKPGMAFICKGGGASGEHTGFVAEVYDDGTFLSIEGNCGNAVKQVRRKISDMYGFVDFSYLYS